MDWIILPPMFGSAFLDIVFYISAGALLIQLLYWLLVYLRVWTHRYPEPDDADAATPVSVVIAARNEADQLQELIPLLYEQDHPDFEVVVVNDRSWDNSKEVLKALVARYPELHVVEVEENRFNQRSGKKFAITLGIKGAREEHLVFTDADCRPQHPQWLRHMSGGFERGHELVIGYSPEKGGGILSRFDSAITGMHYLGFALAGVPYMGVGRNLGYSSELFFESGGFKSHYSLPSGDDDLFVNQAVRFARPAVVIHPESFVSTGAPSGVGGWWRRKRRHVTTSARYRLIHKLLLITYPISALLWLLSGILLMLHAETLWFGVGILGLRALVQTVVMWGVFRRLGWKHLGLPGVLLEPLWYALMACVHVSNRIVKPTAWK
jgi:glycosyltransferase involved in cell wall biosynthesis